MLAAPGHWRWSTALQNLLLPTPAGVRNIASRFAGTMPSGWLGCPLWGTHLLACGARDRTGHSRLRRQPAKKIRFADCDKSHGRRTWPSLCLSLEFGIWNYDYESWRQTNGC